MLALTQPDLLTGREASALLGLPSTAHTNRKAFPKPHMVGTRGQPHLYRRADVLAYGKRLEAQPKPKDADLITGIEAARLIDRPPSVRYDPDFPKPARVDRGPRPNLYSRTEVFAFAARCPEGPVRRSVAPPPSKLVGLPSEAELARSLVRDLEDLPRKKPLPCALWNRLLDGAKDGLDIDAATLTQENARDRRRSPSDRSRPLLASATVRPL